MPVGVDAVGSIQSSVVVMLLRRCMVSFRGTCILRVPKGFQLAVHRFLEFEVLRNTALGGKSRIFERR